MRRIAFCLTLLELIVLLTSSIAQADIVPPAGLAPGDQFRLIFVSSMDDVLDASSANISVYDAFINTAAASAGLDSYAGNHITWFALVSTATVNAKDRLPNSSVAIYDMRGNKIADGSHDIWSGSLLHGINFDETGSFFFSQVWTGTDSHGTGSIEDADSVVEVFSPGTPMQLGTAFPDNGDSGNSVGIWVSDGGDAGIFPNTTTLSFYGYSQVITAKSVPEPALGSLLLTGIALLGFTIRRRL